MLTHWNKLLNTDCLVLGVGDKNVYPIFRNGYTTLMNVYDTQYINEDISKCGHIDVLIRDPEERFESGVNEYCFQNKVEFDEAFKLIQQGKLYDRHFTPQYIWLFHLSKFYKGEVTLRPFNYIKEITDVHRNSVHYEKKDVPAIAEFVDVDKHLMQHLNESTALIDIVKRYKNVLS